MTLSLEEQKEVFLAEQELKHYGVPGMRWGKRKGPTSSSDAPGNSGPNRRDLKALDKQTKARQKAERNEVIDKARAEYNDNARKNYLDAKAQYKTDKAIIGKRAAKEAFDKVKMKNMLDAEVASQAKSGKETVNALLISAALGAVAYTAVKIAYS